LTLYLDASAAVSLFVDDLHSESAKRIIDASDEAPSYSFWTKAEFVSTVMRQWRSGSLREGEKDLVLDRFDEWSRFFAARVEIDDEHVAIAGLIVRDPALKLRAPDALHLAICRYHMAELLTFDIGMAAAARALGLPVATI
jgi:predicted nucleic acid-binding protein